MSEETYIRENAECISMVRKNRECHPGGTAMILMTKEDAVALELRAQRKEKHIPTKKEMMMQAAQLLAPVAMSACWLLGAAEGLADPFFAAVSTGMCVLWAICTWKMGEKDA